MNLSAGASSSWRPIHGDSRRADRWSPRYQGREGIRHGLRMNTPSPTALRLKYGASGKITFAGAAGIAARQSMGLQRHRGWLWRPRSDRSDGCQLWRTEDGKRRSRQNAVRHGLSAETVVEIVEDIDDYRGFEAAIIADYDARTAVERELVLRLASLLWRLRRATIIETELLGIQAEVLRGRRSGHLAAKSRNTLSPIPGNPILGVQDVRENQTDDDSWLAVHSTSRSAPQLFNSARDLAHCFLRLANLDNGVFERLGRYESSLARQEHIYRSADRCADYNSATMSPPVVVRPTRKYRAATVHKVKPVALVPK
jgi:hypothetical protein